MDPNQVRRLEEHIEAAIADELRRHFAELSLRPHTAHLMAKAAVAVLEAVEERPDRDSPRHAGA
jgi:hypothetical protein